MAKKKVVAKKPAVKKAVAKKKPAAKKKVAAKKKKQFYFFMIDVIKESGGPVSFIFSDKLCIAQE